MCQNVPVDFSYRHKITHNNDMRDNISHNTSGDGIHHNELNKIKYISLCFLLHVLTGGYNCRVCMRTNRKFKKKSQTPRHCWVFNAVARQHYFTSHLTCPFYLRIWNKMQNKVSLTEDRKPSSLSFSGYGELLVECSSRATAQKTWFYACFWLFQRTCHISEFL